ncbi:hypothetical protein [Algoriphagus sp. CAU 1675]|uniref:hypothetical protein n=1 Tax=Algoriphagus sp. CAU 1675 TaxID=3032597 RepID=UPI0023DC7F6F|nr:hypothetical protein [Algoriphagus sp. CAU 1675]MDF2158485.1 hypothetical protein [Algoriphagus sp. CAU 1675]
MGRIHAIEWADQTWFPELIRNYMTDFLQFLANKTKMFSPIVPKIEEILGKTQNHQIIDLASGGGGGLLSLNQELIEKIPDVKFLMTDLYPNLKAFQYTQSQAPNFDYSEKPVDAMNVPNHLKGLRTMFLSFHHFRPKDAIQILQSAVKSNQPILIVEGQERTTPSLMAMFFSPLTVLFTTPFIKPFSFKRILFTYILPLVPIFTWWDGIVSSLRTYSVKEMESLITKVPNQEKFDWEVKKIKSGPTYLLYLFGIPNI